MPSLPAATWQVDFGPDQTTASWSPPPTGDADTVFVAAHGAGGHRDDRAMLALTDALLPLGLGMVRFNFVYRERKSGRPDPMPKLEECFRAVIDRVRRELTPRRLVIGGRSMGGRAASMLASEGEPCAGLLLLAYPLHPPGQPGKLRDGHLPAIKVPVLCFNGTRDDFCQRPLMEATLARVGANWQMHWLEAADHSFHVLKRSGRTDQEVMAEVSGAVGQWLTGLPTS